MSTEKFKNKLKCICNDVVIFEIIDDIECDWGNHVVVQCPNCEKLFSIDSLCSAFQNVSELLNKNLVLYSEEEILKYLANSHPN